MRIQAGFRFGGIARVNGVKKFPDCEQKNRDVTCSAAQKCLFSMICGRVREESSAVPRVKSGADQYERSIDCGGPCYRELFFSQTGNWRPLRLKVHVANRKHDCVSSLHQNSVPGNLGCRTCNIRCFMREFDLPDVRCTDAELLKSHLGTVLSATRVLVVELLGGQHSHLDCGMINNLVLPSERATLIFDRGTDELMGFFVVPTGDC